MLVTMALQFTLDLAKKVMAAAEAKAVQNNWYVAISIRDRLEIRQCCSVLTARGLSRLSLKALIAVEFRRPTRSRRMLSPVTVRD